MWQSLREVSLQPLSELCLSFWAIFFNLPVQFLLTTNSAPYWLVLKGYFVFFKPGTPVWPENSSGCWGWRVGLCRLPLRHTTNSMAVLGLGLSAWCWGLTCVPGTAAAPKGGLIMGCANMTGCWGIMVMPVPAGGCKGTKTQSRSGTHECKTRHDTFHMLWNTAEKTTQVGTVVCYVTLNSGCWGSQMGERSLSCACKSGWSCGVLVPIRSCVFTSCWSSLEGTRANFLTQDGPNVLKMDVQSEKIQ